MKKVLILTMGVLAAGAVNAQTSTTSKDIQFGVKAGVNFSNIIKTGNDNYKTSFKPGFHAGLTLDVPIIDRLSFAPEVVFSQKGYKVTGTNLFNEEVQHSVTTNFIEIPILAKIKAAETFSIYLGPQVSFLTSTSTKFTKGDNSYENMVTETNKNLKKSLFGGVLGVGFDVTDQVNINARYTLDFQKNNENGTSETPVYKNQVFQVGVGFKF